MGPHPSQTMGPEVIQSAPLKPAAIHYGWAVATGEIANFIAERIAFAVDF